MSRDVRTEERTPLAEAPRAISGSKRSQRPSLGLRPTEEYEKYVPATQELLQWYDSERRVLPWREDPQPYHVWISEIMLQQTRVDTVIEYYERFLRELPTVADLAAAEEDELLKLWQGLGYYSRIRNMHKAAKMVMAEYDGMIPSTPKELEKLPGIGEYVAAAISSIAYGYPIPSVDGNLLRVYSRVTGYTESIRTTSAKKAAFTYYEVLLPDDRPGDMNQALMDLGATVCLPNGMPECERCPWAHRCEAHAKGSELELPVKEVKKARSIEKRTVLLLRSRDDMRGELVVIRKRPSQGLLANLFEFPNVDGHLSLEDVSAACEDLGFRVAGKVKKLPAAKHIFSHKEWHMIGYEIEVESVSAADCILVTPREIRAEYSIPTAFKKYLERV